MHGNIGCLGSCNKPQVIISMDGVSKEVRTQGPIVTKDDESSDFWSNSTFEKDLSAVQSQRSISSIGMSNNPSDPQSSANPEFLNHGHLLWNQIRQQWVGNKVRSESHTQVGEPIISSNATYDNLLGNNNPFHQPIPLREMIYFLVDIWEQEGLYD